jgi:polysaccharide export outer membrane protein
MQVSVAGESEPSDVYIVDQSGNITLSYQGIKVPVMIRGLTPRMAADEVAKALKPYIKNPQVTVTIRAVPRPTIFISAPANVLRNTGPVIITNDTSLLDALSAAQWTELADLTRIMITRKDKEGRRPTRTVNLAEYLKDRGNMPPDESLNPILMDGDRIYVPIARAGEQTGNFVVVSGEVLRPQDKMAYRSTPPMTVIEAISQAGGTTVSADRKRVLIRRVGNTKPLLVDLDAIDGGDGTNNVELQPSDVVIVSRFSPLTYYFVSGGISKTGRFPYDKPITLTQALMENGGPVPYAKIKQGVIFRHMTPDGDPRKTQIIKFNFDEIQKGKKKDVAVLPGDSIWIQPGSPPTSAPWDIFRVMNLISQGAFLYNQVAGRGFGFGGNGGGF